MCSCNLVRTVLQHQTNIVGCPVLGQVSHDIKGPFTQAIFVAQLNAIFVALKLQLQNRTCKPAAILGNLSPRFEIQLTKHGEFE